MKDSSEDGILPLINIVFLLLIFFMVVGHLAPADQLVDEPLQSSTAQPLADTAAQQPLSVQMGPAGELALDGETLTEAMLLQRLQDSPNSAGVQVKVDGRAEALGAIRLIERLRKAGIASVNLLTLQAGDVEQASSEKPHIQQSAQPTPIPPTHI